MLIHDTTRYLRIPVSRTAPKTKLRLYDGDRLVLDLDTRLDTVKPETVMFYDLAPFAGMNLAVKSDTVDAELSFCATKPAPEDEPRPKHHFTASQGWLNDPNGLVFYEGYYHLFFQHNPVGTEWGNMHWGHAVSRDLLHWTELDEALYPDETGDMYSGSAIIDTDNLLGLKENEHDPLILFYTAAGGNREINAEQPFTQCIAYSTDGAKTFRKYSNNPVVAHIKGANRDPKVIRDPVSGAYVMALYLDGDDYALLTSRTLSDWKLLQTFSLPGDNECPDFYPLRDSDGALKWVFTGAHDCCLIGDFDIATGFHPCSEPYKFGFGRAYAAQTFTAGDPESRLRISWNRFDSMGSKNYNCELGTVCRMTLVNGRLHIAPALGEDTASLHDDGGGLPSHGIRRELSLPCRIDLSLSGFTEPLTLRLFGNTVTLDPSAGILTVCSDEKMPFLTDNGKCGLTILADHLGLELFDHSGRIFGAFAAVHTDDLLILSGEGSLDRLKITRYPHT